MSTRSNIAYENKDGKVYAIYVHSDGYPNGVGHCLLNYYNDYEKAKSLFKFGNASYLGSTLKDCSFYARDWGRDKEKARQYNNEWCFLNDMSGDIFIEYVYLRFIRWVFYRIILIIFSFFVSTCFYCSIY